MSGTILRFPVERASGRADDVWPLGMSDMEIAAALNAGLVFPLISDRLVRLWREGDLCVMPRWIAEQVRALRRSAG